MAAVSRIPVQRPAELPANSRSWSGGSMRLCIFFIITTIAATAQSTMGTLHLKVSDATGWGLRSSVQLISEPNDYHQRFVTDDTGRLTVKRLPFGIYRLEVRHDGLQASSQPLDIRSAAPSEVIVKLKPPSVETTIDVQGTVGLIDPNAVASLNQIGQQTIADRVTSLPGQSVQNLVNSQPGWLYEGNAVLHPRGAEYQTQFVLDGLPLTDDRSPGHGTEIEADNVQSMSIRTAGIPAEFGRKMGGVIEINTARDSRDGLHGQVVLSGGSFDTASAYTMLQYLRAKNTFGFSASGAMTDRYLNPPVPDNFTNNGTTGDFSARYERDFNVADRFTMTYRHEQARYNVPNEQVQQAAGQRQDGANTEDIGAISYQHLFSENTVGNFAAMFRSNASQLSSNLLSTPVIAFQNNNFNQAYFRGAISVHRHNQEWKFGAESDNVFLHERFASVITDPSQFDPGTPTDFSFAGQRPDLEQSAFVQDLIRLGNWTISAGIRWDHYQLVVNQNALSPRIGISRYFAGSDLLVHVAYDRVFQTPASNNILLSSSPDVVVLNPNVLHVPVEPSHGNYYEAGVTKGFFSRFTLDTNAYLRQMNNLADDDLLLNTPVGFPIAFRKGTIYGAEGKLNIPNWRKLSGFVSYSYMVGSAYFPVTGGLFLGQSATDALTQLSGRFWVTQDQRNTVRTRFKCQFVPRLWGAAGMDYGSGLPVDFDGTYQDALAQYGQDVIDRVDFKRRRVRPSLSVDASIGAELWKKEDVLVRMQFDAVNLNNRLNLINFAGLFSGNAIAPPRSFFIRMKMEF